VRLEEYNAAMFKDYEDVFAAAERFGISPSQTRKLCKKGMIPGAVFIARRWFIPKDAWPKKSPRGRPPLRREKGER
jgi:hypothetical protein